MSTLQYLRTSTQYLAAGPERGRLVVRLDTPAPGGGSGIPDPTDLKCPLYPGQEASNFFAFGSDSGFSLAEPVLSGAPLPAGFSYQVRLNGGMWYPTVAAFNGALQTMLPADRKAGFGFDIQLLLPPGTLISAPSMAIFTATYYEA